MSSRVKVASLASLFLGAAILAGCAPKARVPDPGSVRSPAPELRLRADLEQFFSDPQFHRSQWGVLIVSLDRGDILFERESARLLMPASNNKILTAAVSLLRLGPEFRFETRVCTDGELDGEVLRGNLIVQGGGDPSIAPRFQDGDSMRVFREWASRLRERGVRRLEGDLVADGTAFSDPMLGLGWEWDDLAFGYAAPVSALQFHENLLTLDIQPGENESDPLRVRAEPVDDYLPVRSLATTGAAGSAARLRVERDTRSHAVVISGTLPLGGSGISRSVAVENPSEYFLAGLRHALRAEGLDVSRSRLRVAERRSEVPLEVLWTHRSPPLQAVLQPLMKVSQNLYSETMARTLGLALRGQGNFQAGREIVEETLRTMAVEEGTYRYADGSGLSRHNLLSADLLIRVLRFMHRHPQFENFLQTLPIAGVDGTLSSRLKGTAAENNVRAKTGTISGVRSLSGYMRTADGELLAFSMIANNFLVAMRSADFVQDRVLERLANFRR